MKLLLTAAMLLMFLPVRSLSAEDATPFSETEYWNNYCSVDVNSTSDDCERYRVYIRSQAGELSDALKEVEAKKAQFEQDVTQYREAIAQLQVEINDLQNQIADVQAKVDTLQAAIDARQIEIDDKQKAIDETQTSLNAVKEKIKNRMVLQQSSMKTTWLLDLFANAKTFSEWLRIASGLKAIADSDQSQRQEYSELSASLIQQKDALVTIQDSQKADLAVQKSQKEELSAYQGQYLVKQDTIKAAEAAAEDQIAAQIAQYTSISSNIDQVKKTLAAIAVNTGSIQPSSSWTNPVPAGHLTQGTWNYPDGSVHLGNDLTAAEGSNVVAAVNGIIINSSNGCGRGYLGNSCGYQYGGLAGAGNQVVELAATADGGLYAIEYDHLLLSSSAAAGTIVNAGDVIGKVGSSGNSSDDKCHVEIFYLGDASTMQDFLNTWNGDLLFGSGQKGDEDGYGRRCDAGYSAPCRIRPESVLPGV